jgi:pterin-4a-carbinolamine dehydratase
MHHDWSLRRRPARLERQFRFQHYDATREFLERAAQLSQREGYYPDISFGRTYVNVTIYGDDGGEEIGAARRRFASLVDGVLGDCVYEASLILGGTSETSACRV